MQEGVLLPVEETKIMSIPILLLSKDDFHKYYITGFVAKMDAHIIIP